MTDEAMLVERAGVPVHVVEGDLANVKITTPEDLAMARAAVGLSTRLARAHVSAPATISIAWFPGGR